jgi:hypothetical protein
MSQGVADTKFIIFMNLVYTEQIVDDTKFENNYKTQEKFSMIKILN